MIASLILFYLKEVISILSRFSMISNLSREARTGVEDMVYISSVADRGKFIRRLVCFSHAMIDDKTMLFNKPLNLLHRNIHSPWDAPVICNRFGQEHRVYFSNTCLIPLCTHSSSPWSIVIYYDLVTLC